jgi:hypothetical protein
MKEKTRDRERERVKGKVRAASLEREGTGLDYANINDVLHLHMKNQCKLQIHKGINTVNSDVPGNTIISGLSSSTVLFHLDCMILYLAG